MLGTLITLAIGLLSLIRLPNAKTIPVLWGQLDPKALLCALCWFALGCVFNDWLIRRRAAQGPEVLHTGDRWNHCRACNFTIDGHFDKNGELLKDTTGPCPSCGYLLNVAAGADPEVRELGHKRIKEWVERCGMGDVPLCGVNGCNSPLIMTPADVIVCPACGFDYGTAPTPDPSVEGVPL